MNRFVVSIAFLAVAMGAPSHYGSLVSAPVASAPAVVGQTHHSYAAGPAVVENRVEYGVVGARTVQTGVASVVGGHQYVVAGQEAIPQPATSYVVGAPQNIVETRPIAPPAIPAPADTVTVQKIAAPVRSHGQITPQVTNIVPEVQVNKYNVDVPVAVPRAVPREIITHTHVAKPYEVAVPRAVPVPAPYKVHPVQEIVETPHIHHATVETHSTQAVVTAHATPVHAVAQAPVAVSHHAVAAPALGYAGHAFASPVGAVGAVGAAYNVGWNAAAPVATIA